MSNLDELARRDKPSVVRSLSLSSLPNPEKTQRRIVNNRCYSLIGMNIVLIHESGQGKARKRRAADLDLCCLIRYTS